MVNHFIIIEFCLFFLIGKSFAFITFSDEACVDYCMSKKAQFNDEYGITMKRLLPDSITKSERLISSTDLVIRIGVPGKSFYKYLKIYFCFLSNRSTIHRCKYSFIFW